MITDHKKTSYEINWLNYFDLNSLNLSKRQKLWCERQILSYMQKFSMNKNKIKLQNVTFQTDEIDSNLGSMT